VLGLMLVSAIAIADDSKLSDLQRQEIIRVFLAERPFVHRAFPQGKEGLHIEGEKITPSDAELNQMIAQSGPAAKIGERAKITAVRFVHHGIVFEINGGPVKRKRLRDRMTVGIGGVDTSTSQSQQSGDGQLPADDSVNNNSHGSYVLLSLNENVSNLTTDKLKDMLAPVLDFKAMNQAEAYQKSLPPVLAAAVKNHHALVGMDKEMVLRAVGRPPRRIRETKDNHEIEEWIYGAPPQDVEFIRFMGEKVVSIEDMNVAGEKRERTEDEVGDLGGALNASTQQHTRPDAMSAPAGNSGTSVADDERRSAPSLLRPGEKSVEEKEAGRDPKPQPAPDPNDGPNTGKTYP
jgi:hypothetical protein